MISNKKILATGINGFIDSRLVEMLLDQCCKAKVLSRYNSFSHWEFLNEIPDKDNQQVKVGDIRNPYFCNCLMENSDIIFHLAALVAIPYSYVATESYLDTNVLGTYNICQTDVEKGNNRIVYTSTSVVDLNNV